ncbi:uncharacterized protein LTR77_010498 [Saxophila tyrrhenica]|uniref:Uncharacterized protein n=1 Tax=Saxophila tyrrhenica TaxID=1690608 RepID=A0AAV9NYX3_9PEZI|nr:hypothetical protein LTR77_010498 [Saxophila tyrrhenica]
MTDKTPAILYALTTPHPSQPQDHFNTWYDNVHAPSRARCPGVHQVARWVATDDSRPGWLATYELNDASALQTDAYKQARLNDGDDETTMFSDLSRRVYNLLSDKTCTEYATYCASGKPRAMTHVAVHPDKSTDLTDDEFNKWYEEEHVPLLSKCPGWLRSTRWVLVDEKDPRNGQFSETARFLACHEWEDADVVYGSDEFSHAVTTPWRTRVMSNIDRQTEERRLFQLWRQFLPDGTSVAAEQKQTKMRSWGDIKAVPTSTRALLFYWLYKYPTHL